MAPFATGHQTVVYTVKRDGTGHVDIRVEGERGQNLLYIALGIAAHFAYLTLQPVMVLENGLPHRWVAVHMPPPITGGP